MSNIFPGRYTAVTNEPFVVFLIGMRINKLRLVHKWWPVAMAMGPMLKTLYENPQKGFLSGHSYFDFANRTSLLVQYWRSFEDLEDFARNPADPHLGAWQRFNKAVGKDGTVGIWHETYKVRAGEYETMYGNMPRFGLASAFEHMPITRETTSARKRITQGQETAEYAAAEINQIVRS